MPIAREGPFLVTHDLGITPCLGIESSQLEACLAKIRERPYQGVFGFPGFGFAEDNLDFLRRVPWLRMVWFWDVKLRRVDGLYALEHLQYFGVHPKRPGIDFARFPELQTIIWTYNPKDRGLAELLEVRRFHVWHYNPKHRQFTQLPVPANVEELELNWANPASLDGLRAMPRLRRLSIARCRNLVSLEQLPAVAPNLEWLHVQACGRLSGEHGAALVRELPKLRSAYVQDRWLVGPERPAA